MYSGMKIMIIFILLVLDVILARKFCGKDLVKEVLNSCSEVSCDEFRESVETSLIFMDEKQLDYGIIKLCCHRRCTSDELKQFCCSDYDLLK
uniref:Insulin-like domain-containing protein n=1 Tax=Acrobeloides nanus TaxID=290746 RepID=A0A914C748_9BILA